MDDDNTQGTPAPSAAEIELQKVKAKNAELLEKLAKHDAKGLPPGVDAATVRELLEFKQKAEQSKLESEGKYTEARQQLEAQFRTREAELQAEIEQLKGKVRDLEVLTPAVSALRDVVHEPSDFLKLRLKPEQLATEADGTVVVVDGYTRTPLQEWARTNGKAFELKKPPASGSGAPAGGGGTAAVAPGGKNPFSKEHFNLTEQARLYAVDRGLYDRLKAAAQ